MRVLIMTSSANAAGLTATCAEAARQGIVDGRSPARALNLNELEIARCSVCDDGWGTCRSEHRCRIDDDFQSLHESIRQAEGYVVVTPVYFGEPSEVVKATLDRLRRCEATKDESAGESSVLAAKPTILIACAGGSGHGAVHCLAEMERALAAVRADVFDTIPVTQRTRGYQSETIHDALASMVSAAQANPAALARRSERGERRPGRSPRRRRH